MKHVPITRSSGVAVTRDFQKNGTFHCFTIVVLSLSGCFVQNCQ